MILNKIKTTVTLKWESDSYALAEEAQIVHN